MFGPTFEELELLDSGNHEFTLHRLARYYVENLGPWGPIETAWISAFDSGEHVPARESVFAVIAPALRHMKVRDLIRSDFMMDLFRVDRRLDSDAAFKMFEGASQAGLSDSIATLPFHQWLATPERGAPTLKT